MSYPRMDGKIDILWGLSYLYKTCKQFTIRILRMFSEKINYYDKPYNHYNIPKKIYTLSKSNCIWNKDQDMNEDYGFFIILDEDSLFQKPVLKYSGYSRRESYMHHTNICIHQPEIVSVIHKNNMINTNNISEETLYPIIQKYAFTPVIHVCDAFHNILQWIYSYRL
jgi:hypothetical protein